LAVYCNSVVPLLNYTRYCTDVLVFSLQILEAQQTLAAILAVSQTLQDLHKRLASSMMSSTSDSAMDYAAEKTEQTPGVLALLKSKELQLQVQVDKCAQLRAENVLLYKKLQVRVNRCWTAVLHPHVPSIRDIAQHSSSV